MRSFTIELSLRDGRGEQIANKTVVTESQDGTDAVLKQILLLAASDIQKRIVNSLAGADYDNTQIINDR